MVFHLRMELDTFSRKRVMLLPGGGFQLPLLRKLKVRGYIAICADRSENAPCRQEADIFLPIGVDQREALLAKVWELKPAAILTCQTDSAVRTVAYLCEQLNLPGIGNACAELFTNKYAMRKFCTAHGFPVPRYQLCTSFSEVATFAEELGYPVVLKPVSNQSSKGVHKVNDKAELVISYDDTLKHNDGTAVLVEAFIGGVEFTAEGFKTSDKHYTLAISEQKHYSHAPTVAYRLFYAPENPTIDYSRLRSLNDALVEASGLPFGITHGEYKFYNNQFLLMEIAARGGGTRIASDLVPVISGVDIYDYLIDYALGSKPSLFPRLSNCRCGLLEFFQAEPGKIKAIEGLEALKQLPGVVDAIVFYQVGQEIPKTVDKTTRAGYFLAVAATPLALAELEQQILQSLRIEYEPNPDF